MSKNSFQSEIKFTGSAYLMSGNGIPRNKFSLLGKTLGRFPIHEICKHVGSQTSFDGYNYCIQLKILNNAIKKTD